MSSTSTCRDPGPSISRQASMINRQRSYKYHEGRPYESQGKYVVTDYVTYLDDGIRNRFCDVVAYGVRKREEI